MIQPIDAASSYYVNDLPLSVLLTLDVSLRDPKLTVLGELLGVSERPTD